MTDNAPTPARPERPEASSKSSYRATPVSTVDSRLTGGSGVQRSHLKDRKAWLKSRNRAGRTWAQRKAASVTYCPAKTRAA